MDKVELFNRLAKVVRPAFSDYKPLESLDTPWAETGLDSMDAMMFGVYLDAIYGIEPNVSKDWVSDTPSALFALYEAHATIAPASVDTALEGIE